MGHRRGVTRLGVVVILSLLTVGASYVAAGLSRVQGMAGRSKCSNDLRQLGLAALQQADDTGLFPHVRARQELDGGVESADTPRALRGLVRRGYLDSPQVFVCPSSNDAAAPDAWPEPWTWGSARGWPDADPLGPGPTADPTLAGTRELSYGWTRRGLNSNVRSTTPLAAERAVRHEAFEDPGVTSDDPLQGNHVGGLSVLSAAATVSWWGTQGQDPGNEQALADLTRTEGPGAGALAIVDPRRPRAPRSASWWSGVSPDAAALLPFGLAGVLLLIGRAPAPPPRLARRPRRAASTRAAGSGRVARLGDGSALQVEQRCPYCHDGLRADAQALTSCSGCRAVFHADCVPEDGACTTLGCEARAA